MASTITLQGSINWAQCFGKFKPLTIGASNEPALTCANILLTTILGGPFKWPWNRNTVSFLAAQGVQDNSVAVTDFGFIETASFISAASITNTALTSNVATYTAPNTFKVGDTATVIGTTNGAGVFNVTLQPIIAATPASFSIALVNANIASAADTGTATAGNVIEVTEIRNRLGTGKEQGPPATIAAQMDDNAGHITFRTLPAPDGVYQINVIYQKKPALLTAPTSTWAPIPDQYSQIYQWGFLALMAAFWEDPRYPMFNQKFVAGLLSAAEGLSEEEVNTFLLGWQDAANMASVAAMKHQQGIQGRGM